MTKQPRILVIDDEDVVCQSCERILSEEGYAVDTTEDPRVGLALSEQTPYDIVLVDLKMPELGGMEILRQVKALRADTDVVIMTGYAEIATAVEAMKLGAADYIPKPFSPDQLLVTIAKSLETKEILSENLYLRRELESQYQFENLVGTSRAMQAVYDLIARVSHTSATALIRGESGTGKELIARAIHYNSPRKAMRFMAVDCGSLNDSLLESELFGHVKGAFTGAIAAKRGIFEVADGGTLFLDEIGNTSLMLQAKLLRVLQERVFIPVGGMTEKETDVRVIAATNKDLDALLAEGSFREDLFYRLNIVPIHVPPLRDRREDIPALVKHFLTKLRNETDGEACQITSDALARLVDYNWPGNVRELENVIHRAVVLATDKMITSEQLPPELHEQEPTIGQAVPQNSHELKLLKSRVRRKSVERIERVFVTEALVRNNWNVTHAAAQVGMKRPNFQALMRKYHITRPEDS